MQSGHELIVVDPLNKQNNVARSTYQFMNIKVIKIKRQTGLNALIS